ncbi:UNVERIFIED_CONTAM: hypothetical protein Cloal_2368 [Acetivibrio alkalicellulosi]
MGDFRKHPDSNYRNDYKNQFYAKRGSENKGEAVMAFLKIGSPIFIISIILLGLKFSLVGSFFLYLYCIMFIGLILYCIKPIPKIKCSKCGQKMKKNYWDIGGGYHAIFLICEKCKFYVDTGYSID